MLLLVKCLTAIIISLPVIVLLALAIVAIIKNKKKATVQLTPCFLMKKSNNKKIIYQSISCAYSKDLKNKLKCSKSVAVIFSEELKKLFNALDYDTEYLTTTHLLRQFEKAQKQSLIKFTIKDRKLSGRLFWAVWNLQGLKKALKYFGRKTYFYLISFKKISK